MAAFVFTNPKLWLAGYELEGVLSTLALNYGAEIKDATVFGNTTRIRKGGLKTVAGQVEGFYDATTIDAALFSRIGAANVPVTCAPDGAGAEGERAFALLAALGEYRIGGELGEMSKLSLPLDSGGPLVKGTIVHNAARTATGNGTAFQLGAVSATQKLYAALHVVAAAGTTPTLDVSVQSDNAQGFASPAAQITFTQATAIASEWKELAGAVADDWWRVSFTVGGASPSFTFAVFLGIL